MLGMAAMDQCYIWTNIPKILSFDQNIGEKLRREREKNVTLITK